MKQYLRNTWDIFLKAGAAAAGMFLGLTGNGQTGLVLLIACMGADLALASRSSATDAAGGKAGTSVRSFLKQPLSQQGVLLVLAAAAFLADSLAGGGSALFFSTATWFAAACEVTVLLKRFTGISLPVPAWLKKASLHDTPPD